MPVVVPGNLVPPATGTPQTVPVDLPSPTFVNDADGLNAIAILNDMIATFESPEYANRTLYPAEVEQLLINLYAYRELLVRNAIQYCGMQNLLAFAVYPMIDYLGQYLGITRLQRQAATAPFLVTLTAAQTTPTDIPAGTQIGTQDGAFIFATTEDLTIPAGATTGTVEGACTTAGSGGNGYLAGKVSVLLAANPLVQSIANTETTANGSDGEPAGTQAGDNALRKRIQAAPNNLTTAGPSGQYRSLALDVSASIVDAQTYTYNPNDPNSPPPGSVKVFILTGPVSQPAASPNNAGIASGALIAAVQAALSPDTVRPICDSVTVAAVEEVDYTVTGAVTLYANANYATVSAGVTAAAQQLALALAANIQQNLVVNQWVTALKVAGVYDLDLQLTASVNGGALQPDTQGNFALSPGQWANCTAINLTIVMGSVNQPVS